MSHSDGRPPMVCTGAGTLKCALVLRVYEEMMVDGSAVKLSKSITRHKRVK